MSKNERRHALPPPDYFYRPAMPPLALIGYIERWLERRRLRHNLRALLSRDDHMLKDLGLERTALRRRLDRVGASHRTK